jgi:DNA-binding transcriptional LysR family regulator
MPPDRLLGVEVRHLVALQAIAERGSFHGAAERLGYTQSAVSQQIATLERAVGHRLLTRPGGPRPVTLTEAGRVLLRHADALVARLAAARADLDAVAQGAVGALRVGAFQSAGARILPPLLRRFGEEWPEVEVLLTESTSGEDLIGLVEAGELDLIFAALPVSESLATLELLRDPYVLLLDAESELAAQEEPLTWSQIAALPLIGSRECRPGLDHERQLRDRGHVLSVRFRSDDNGTVIGLVASGIAGALVARLVAETAGDRVVVRELPDPPLPPRLVGVAWQRERELSAPAQDFLALAEEVCAALWSPAASA